MSDQKDILIRYGEIGLKGKNRPDFEKILVRNLKQALRDFTHGPVERPHGRVVVRSIGRSKHALEVVSRIPGVISASIAFRADVEMQSIEKAARALMAETLGCDQALDPIPFKVQTTRTNKRFEMTSMELSAHLGGVLIKEFPGLKAQMHDPKLRLMVEVRSTEVLLSLAHVKGPGGLPVGSTGKAVVLLSGGIDSPVAAHMAMKRGARCVFINFDAHPFIPMDSLDKIKRMVKRLSVFQGRSLLFVVPFADIQVAIKKQCPEPLRTILYRRMMMRLAGLAAAESGSGALVTGESLGQVASQTLENIHCIGAVADLPVLRPLIGFDKTETVAIAEQIDTYRISIQPYPDCCTVFQPRKPKIRADMAEVETAEENLAWQELVQEAFSKTDRITIDP